MQRTNAFTLLGLAVVWTSVATAEFVGTHKVVLASAIKWQAAPPSLPAGAEAAVLDGDPNRDDAFVLRIKAPKGYRIPLHTHPKAEVITIVSGKLNLGMNTKGGAEETLPAGSLASLPAGVAHRVSFAEDAIVQINANGPFAIDYVDPKDDPRLNIAPGGSGAIAKPD
jgi:quercetin dioxygenase-like cupin family protein